MSDEIPVIPQVSLQLKVGFYKDRVIVDFGALIKNISLSPNAARDLALQLRRYAARVEQEAKKKK